MFWIVAIAIFLAILRTELGPVLLVLNMPGIAFVGGPWLTARTVRWLNRRLIRTRKEPVSETRRVVEMVLLASVVILGIVFTLVLGLILFVGMWAAVNWISGGVN